MKIPRRTFVAGAPAALWCAASPISSGLAPALLFAAERPMPTAPKPSDTAKGFAPPGGGTFKSSTSNHCDVPTTYWGDVMSSF